MNESQVDVVQLQKRDPQAWTVLLSNHKELQDVIVTAVVAQPLQRNNDISNETRHITRYLVSLSNHSDPVPFISKKTSEKEALFYRHISPAMPSISPHCWYSHLSENHSWIVLDDVPNQTQPDKWLGKDVEEILHQLAMMHTTFWNRQNINKKFHWLPHFVGRKETQYTWSDLEDDYAIYFEKGPAAPLSEHALQHVGSLAPKFLEAANGLAVLRALNGWPGVLGESHLAAAADLIDDPVPMLEPLLQLPVTLIHGRLKTSHCHLTLFGDHRFLDWDSVAIGPGIFDLVHFQEGLELAYSMANNADHHYRISLPITEETVIDTYLLNMKTQLGNLFDARQARMAIPAARCLFVLTHWFPQFASWFGNMPNQYVWQKVNRMSSTNLDQQKVQNMVGVSSHLKRVFQRFLQSYRML